MEFRFYYSKRDTSDSLEKIIENKLTTKLAKYFRDEPKADISFRGEGKQHTMKVVLSGNSMKFTASSTSEDMYKNVDECANKLQTQVKKSKMQYRTDSRKVNAQVKFSSTHNLEQFISLEN